MNKNLPIILAIDTSCDETSVAITQGHNILSNIVSSQVELHKPYGGVFPTIAKKAHKENIDPSISLAIKRAKIKLTDLDAIAVTQGPGLAPALEVGIEKAKKLSLKLKIKLIAINHIEGHALSVLCSPTSQILHPNSHIPHPIFPILSIVISGGHTEFILIKKIGNYKRLGFTIDDAAGECLDKIGRLLGLGYPAGAVIEEFAKKGNPDKFIFPLPMTQSQDFNLSFSGLKTHSSKLINNLELNKQNTYDFCASLQQGVFKHITYKLNKLLTKHQVKEVWLGGGVAANITLRKAIRETIKPFKLKLKLPYNKKLCGDNAAMIGIVGFYKFKNKQFSQLNIDRQPKWHLPVL
jgi:N6-L-threonylcarbamoyladenine synthase